MMFSERPASSMVLQTGTPEEVGPGSYKPSLRAGQACNAPFRSTVVRPGPLDQWAWRTVGPGAYEVPPLVGRDTRGGTFLGAARTFGLTDGGQAETPGLELWGGSGRTSATRSRT
jgi:hypothetical protein